MRTQNNLLNVRFIRILLCVIVSTLATGCTIEKDEETAIFAFEFWHQNNYDDQVIHVNFITDDLSILPEVEVNGHIIDRFNYAGRGFVDIPFSQAINYRVTANGKTTSGSISMPEELIYASINGVTLSNSSTNYVNQSNSYDISWQQVNCDYQKFYINDNNVFISDILDGSVSNYTIYEDQLAEEVRFLINLDLYNGDKLIAGATPSVLGEYGMGFVTAISDNEYFVNIESGPKSKQIVKKEKLSPEDRFQDFSRRFEIACLTNNNPQIKNK